MSQYGWKVCSYGPVFDPEEHAKRGCSWEHDGTGPPCSCDLPVRAKDVEAILAKGARR